MAGQGAGAAGAGGAGGQHAAGHEATQLTAHTAGQDAGGGGGGGGGGSGLVGGNGCIDDGCVCTGESDLKLRFDCEKNFCFVLHFSFSKKIQFS
jgi:hypothetical protein